MKGGFRFHGPLDKGRTQFASFQPDILTPIRVAAAAGWIFAAAADSGGQLTVVARTDGGQEEWIVVLGEGVPAWLYVNDGEVVAIDRDAISYRLDATTGDLVERSDALQVTLAGFEGLPVQDLVFAAEGSAGIPEVFLLASDRGCHKVLSRVWLGAFYGGGEGRVFDDGVGPLPGQMLDPLVLAYDRGRQRMVVIERRGTLQVLDATEPGQPRHYITRWGGFGNGEFLVTPLTAVAVAVDGDGRVHVADAATPGGRVQSFAP